jgi:hypothetical protein
VRVKRAQLIGHGGGTTVTASATQALENAANVLLAKQNIEKSREVAANCQERAAVLETESVAKQSAAAEAAEETAQAKAAAAELKEKANEAKEASKTQACSGTLQLTLKGADLPDTDGFFNKSDPFYQIYGADGYVTYLFDCQYWIASHHPIQHCTLTIIMEIPSLLHYSVPPCINLKLYKTLLILPSKWLSWTFASSPRGVWKDLSVLHSMKRTMATARSTSVKL